MNSRVVDIDDDEPVVGASITVRTTPTPVRSTISTPRRRRAAEGARDLTRASGEVWDATALKDYVLRRIGETTRAHCTVPPERLGSIFIGFLNRYGAERARQIAEFAFEGQSEPGWWYSSPITPTRFCKGADKFFGDVISGKLDA